MISKILAAMDEFYKNYHRSPHYILLSKNEYGLLEQEGGKYIMTSNGFFGTVSENPPSFHGLKIILVTGDNRLEIA